MKLSLFLLLAALSFFNPSIANPVAPDAFLRPSPFDRARNGMVLPKYVSPYREDPISQPKVGSTPWIEETAQSIKSRIQNLPVRSWFTSIPKNAENNWKLVQFGFKYRVNPTRLFIVDENNRLQSAQPFKIRQVVGDVNALPGKEGNVWTFNEEGQTLRISGEFIYHEIRLARKSAIKDFANQQYDLLHPNSDSKSSLKRSLDVLQNLDGPPGGSTATDSSQDAAAVFEQYLEMLDTVQARVGALIAPVLDNFTAQTDNTLIHQMALSIYYDLTGSTITLVGPFNYGMSFLGNLSTTSIGQGGNNTIITNGTVSDVAQAYKKLENIYTYMYMQAMTAANSTGLFMEQIYLASCLYTDETSVYPPGFDTVKS